jgi:phospholipid transport system substrate-binding protein
MRTLPILLMVWLLLVVPVKAASPPTQAASPLEYTRTILEQARAIVASDQTHNDKLVALSALFGKFLDTDAMAQEALGPRWSSFTPAQQKDFLGLFRQLMQRTYVQKLLLFENPNFVYAGQQQTGAGAVVDTKIVTPRDQFDVRYLLRPVGDTWEATAITVEDVSLTANLGSQLSDLLSRMSIDDLLTLMRRKYGNPSEAAPS